jgi:agmatine deiminase
MTATAAQLGYHMPAEWVPLDAVWLVRPHNAETWPNCLDQAQAQWDAFAAALAQYVRVRTTDELNVPTVDSWIRDFGPVFVLRCGEGDAPPLACHDFVFNGWGGKYEDRSLDDVVPQHIARELGVPLFEHSLVLEGGSIEVNGVGTVMTTEQCLLNPNRNPHLSRNQIERDVHEALGTRHTIWLPGGIVGDDTDGHIDDIARFVAVDHVVATRAPAGHPDHDVLERNWEALQLARDQDGRPLQLTPLPAPDPVMYDFPPDRFGPGGVNPVPASYANFLIANGCVCVPIFGQKTDDLALRTLEAAMPDHKIIGLRAEHLVVGLGAFHCLSQQQPRVTRP